MSFASAGRAASDGWSGVVVDECRCLNCDGCVILDCDTEVRRLVWTVGFTFGNGSGLDAADDAE
jgi:hypothetical protein